MAAQDQIPSNPEAIKLSFGGQSVDWHRQKRVSAVNTSDVQTRSIRQAVASHASIRDAGSDGQAALPAQFIHLIDSRHLSPGGHTVPNDRGVLWRGKINAVPGCSLGTLTADQA